MLFPWLHDPVQAECKYCDKPASYVPDLGEVCEGCLESVERWEIEHDKQGEGAITETQAENGASRIENSRKEVS